MIKKILFIFFSLLCSYMFSQELVADSLHNKLETSKNPSEKLVAYISLAEYYMHQIPNKGRDYLNSAKNLASQEKDTFNLFNIAEIEANIYYILGDSQKEISKIKEALLLVQNHKNKKLEARALKLLGNAYYEVKDYNSQLKNYLKASLIVEKLKDTSLQIQLYNAIGVAYTELKMYKKSLINYEKGIELYSQISTPISKSIEGTLWGNSGIAYEQLGNYEEALRRAIIAKKIRESIKNWGQIAGSNIDIANAYEKMQQIDTSLFYNKQSIVNYKKIKNNGGLLVSYKNLARLYEKKSFFKDALRYKKIEDSLQGLILNRTIFKKQAYLLAEIEYGKKIKDLNYEKTTLQQISFKRKILGFFGFFVLICTLIIMVFFRREDKKSKEINKVLSKSNTEKEILLREVNHRVKNNLQLVSSLLSLQSKTIKDKKIKQILLEGTDRIKSISLVHHRLYKAGSFTDVEFQTYISQIVENLITSFNSVDNVDFEINSIEDIDIDFAISLGLILNEMVTNTLKHNLELKKIKIEIIFVKKNSIYELKVSDNGKGFDISTVRQENTLGMRLISILTNQFDGKLQITSKKNEGVAYVITIPIS